MEIQKDKFYDFHNLKEVTVIDSLIKIVKKEGSTGYYRWRKNWQLLLKCQD